MLFVFMSVTFPLGAEDQGAGKWEVVSSKNNITIENRTLKGFEMKQLRGQCEIDAPIEVIYEVLDNAERHNEWIGDCVLQKDVKRISEYEKISYLVIAVPWPLRDRDTVERVTTKADWNKGEVEYRVDSIRSPEDSKWGMDPVTKENGRVRMPVMEGVYTFSRITPDKSKFTYVAIAEPGIPLPGWVLNIFSTSQPYKTLDNLRKQVKKQIYWEMASKRHNKTFTPDSKKK
jgi:hypothetical protein